MFNVNKKKSQILKLLEQKGRIHLKYDLYTGQAKQLIFQCFPTYMINRTFFKRNIFIKTNQIFVILVYYTLGKECLDRHLLSKLCPDTHPHCFIFIA